MSITIEKSSYDIPDPGTYQAKLVDVSLEDGDYGEQVKCSFDALDGSSFTDLWYFCSTTLSPQSKLGKLYTTLAELDFSDLPSQVDVEDLVGSKAQVVIEHAQSKSTGNDYAKITTVLPLSTETLPDKWQEKLRKQMDENEVPDGVLQSLFSVSSLSELTKEQAKQLSAQMKAGPLSADENSDIPF